MARPQDKNLKPFTSEQNREEAVKNGKKGGVASGEARRRKRSMKESFETLLAMPTNDKYKAALKRKGIEVPEDMTNEQVLVVSMMANAIAGDSRMAALMLDVLGERQSDRLKAKELELKEKAMSDTKNDALDKLDEILRGLHEQAENDI